MKFYGIGRRWMLNGILALILIVLFAFGAFVLSIANYYYEGIRTSLEAKAKTAADVFTTYVSRNYVEYLPMAFSHAESFEEKDRIELQFINTRGRVETSSYFLSAGSNPGTKDIAHALETGEMKSWIGYSANTGEHILSVSCPMLTADGQIVSLMRYVTSLKLVDAQVIRATAFAAAVGLFIIGFVLLTNIYFVRTITVPIRDLTVMAKRIAEGSYGIQVEKKYDDEIGQLTDTINEMSIKIGQSEKVQTEFISSVSHELRTPLTAITGWSETLMYDEDIKGDSLRGINIIAKEAGRLTKMVEDLLEFTRIQDGRFNLNVSIVDLTAEIEDGVYTYGELLRQDGMELEYIPCDEELPFISGDVSRIRQVFLNIVDNAAKYGRDGKKIVISTAVEEKYIAVRIRDFGPGIPEAKLPFVTRKFYKGNLTDRGSGIGLSVCDEIVARHEGTLTIENAEGGGTAVTVRLPLSNA